MVARSGFYTTADGIHRYDVHIEWDMGFSRDAKIIYVGRLHKLLSERLPGRTIEEVTTASPNEIAKLLSPIYVTFDDGESLEDVWHKLKEVDGKSVQYAMFKWPIGVPWAFLHYYCYYAKHMLPIIDKIDVFTDVFYNPEKGGSTQAEACAVLQLLYRRNKLGILNNMCEFVSWCEENMQYRR